MHARLSATAFCDVDDARVTFAVGEFELVRLPNDVCGRIVDDRRTQCTTSDSENGRFLYTCDYFDVTVAARLSLGGVDAVLLLLPLL